jgi:DNA invertase Pin-like site-specific DNA recombinase
LTLNHTVCQVREVAYLLSTIPCDRCHQPAARFSTAERVAIDLDLDHPILLLITISVHFCAPCRHYFRAQPPFLRPDASYTNRVVATAVAAVYQDGMAMRRVPERLARDFWVRPSEASIRQWCRAYRTRFDFATDYQPWVVQAFSGVLCVDEVYQGQLAFLFAVDPAAPDGDRLVGYQLIQGDVDAALVEQFLQQLRDAGIHPDEVITDGSSLYPSVLTKIWPTAAHQLCLFHETRHVTRAVLEVIQAVRRTLPTPPPKPGRRWGGRLRTSPPTDDPDDPDYQRWQLRRATRQAGIAQVHLLARQGLSQRAIARQLGIHRRTVKVWLALDPSPEVPDELARDWHDRRLPDADTRRRQARQAKHAQVRELAEQGHSYCAIARQVGIHRVTVSNWLNQAVPDDPPQGPIAPPESTTDAETPSALPSTQPPPPWQQWDAVRQVREDLQEHRYLFLRRPDHLIADQQTQIDALLASPVGPQLQVARRFLLVWYLLWHDAQGQRRTPEEARERFAAWSSDASYAAVAPLRRVQERMTAEFERLSHFLRHPRWEATNNGAERTGRAFRHRQAPHFNLRTKTAIEGAIVVMACQRKAAATTRRHRELARCSRGRKPQQQMEVGAAA